MKLTELLSEGLLQHLPAKVAKDLNIKLAEKGASSLSVAEVVTSPEGNGHVRVKMNSRVGMLTKSAIRRVLDDYLQEKFAPGNLMGIDYTISLASVKNSYHIYFHRAVSEGVMQVNESSPVMIEKVAKKIEKDLDELNNTISDEIVVSVGMKVGDAKMLPFTVAVFGPSSAVRHFRYSIHLSATGNSRGSEWYSACDRVHTMLEDKGYIGGMLPVDVSAGHSPTVGIYTIHVE